MGTPLRVLIVEDNADDADLLLRELQRGGYEVHWERVDSPETLVPALTRTWDVILSDFNMPHLNALTALEICQKRNRDVPFIVVSGSVSEEEAVTAMRAGAADFVSKLNPVRLCPAIARELRDQKERDARRKAEVELQKAQKIEAVGQLAGGIAHDFNNILSVILGHVELLLREVPGEDPRRRRLESICEAATRAASLTQRLLAFSSRQVLQPTLLHPNQVIADVLQMLERLIGENIEVSTALDPGLWLIKADLSQIEQILMNLALNARDAMATGGTLRIATRNLSVPADTSELPAGNYVTIEVTDSGHGMDADTLSRVFEPFFTTKAPGKGTGLGLATVYGIVKQSGGSIDVESRAGHGATFRIRLPRAGKEGGGLALPARPSRVVAGGSETILVLEDEAALRLMICEILREAGYHVLEAEAPEATVQRALDDKQPIDLLLADVVMPRISGVEAAERLKAVHVDLRVAFMSGYAESSGHSQRVEPIITKPFGSAALLKFVRQVLDTPR